MLDKKNLFADFPKLSKEDWLEKVAAELKGKPFDALCWDLEDIHLKPFYQKDDLQGADQHIHTNQASNDWKIGEDLVLSDPKLANKLLLEALENGVDAPNLILEKELDEQELMQVLKTVRLDFIESNFYLHPSQDLNHFTNTLSKILLKENIDTRQIQGGIFSAGNEIEKERLMEIAQQFPRFKLIRIHIDANISITQNLAKGLWEASNWITELNDLGFSVDQANQLLQFSIAIGKNYFVEIAKIRALKLLWANILKAFAAKEIYEIYLEARLSKQSQEEDTHHNMISATTQSMSAILAGVNCLNVLPADHYTEKHNPFTKRIARNVQHLLKMESYFDKVIDPAAGSYYIEELTQQIFHKSWEQFLLLEKKA